MSTRTLVLCKPDAVERGLVGEIVGRLERKGLTIVALELRTIDADLAGRHYDEHRERPFFDDLVSFITRSPLVAMVIEGGPDTWQVVRNLMGVTNPREAAPGTIRGDCALKSGTTSCMVPACLRQPAGNQDLLPGARSPFSRRPVDDAVPPRQQPVSAFEVISRWFR